MTSVEKVRAFLAGEFTGEIDEETARSLGMLRLIGPMAAKMLPTDPDELDQLLERGAMFCLAMRSDHAVAVGPELLEYVLSLEDPLDVDARQLEAGQ